MADFGVWLGWNTAADLAEWLGQADRADSISLMVGMRGTSVTLARGASTIAAQSMLIVPAGSETQSSETGRDSGTAAREQVLIVGTDALNIRRGDRLSYKATPAGRLNYEVIRVEKLHTGMVQAFAEVVD
jgi:hypothetical protein